MTFDANVPNGGQSPGLFPTQANTNFARLKTLINAEHVFNDTAAVNDGVHRQMTLVDRTNPVSLPAGTNMMMYSNASIPRTYDGISNTWLLEALAALSVTATNGTIVTLSSKNVTFTKQSTGNYTATFPVPLPNTNGYYSYNVRTSNTQAVLFYVATMKTYTVNAMTFRFTDLLGNLIDPDGFSLMVYKG